MRQLRVPPSRATDTKAPPAPLPQAVHLQQELWQRNTGQAPIRRPALAGSPRPAAAQRIQRTPPFNYAAGVAALLLVLAAVLALSAPAGAEQLRGADLHPQTVDHSRAAISTEFRMLHSSGATSVRFDIAWHSFEWSGPGQE